MKARYLTFFSYIGSTFRSSEKLWLKQGRNYTDPESVQGLMEISLLKLRSLIYPNIVLSSRTDGGVHALNASAHFDLERYGSDIYEPNNITYLMNKFFYKQNYPIYIKKCLRVNDNFHARFNAIGRVYLYRLAVIKEDFEIPEHDSIASSIPVEEWKRCHFIRLHNFNIEKFKEGAKYLVGLHDFTTFKKFDKLHQNKHNRRAIESVEVTPGRPLVTKYTQTKELPFEYWDIEIRGRAFVHNQIRRMIGTLISVAVGKLQPKDVKVMLQIPSKHSWHTFIQCGPPDGLYLCDVLYRPEDLVYGTNTNSVVTNDIEEDEDCE